MQTDVSPKNKNKTQILYMGGTKQQRLIPSFSCQIPFISFNLHSAEFDFCLFLLFKRPKKKKKKATTQQMTTKTSPDAFKMNMQTKEEYKLAKQNSRL